MTNQPEASCVPSDQQIAENPSLYRAACEAAATALPAAVYDWAERVTLAVLRVALPMHETQHADALRLAAERATHFELEAMRRAEERDAATARAEKAEAQLALLRNEPVAAQAAHGKAAHPRQPATATTWTIRWNYPDGPKYSSPFESERWARHCFASCQTGTSISTTLVVSHDGGPWREVLKDTGDE